MILTKDYMRVSSDSSRAWLVSPDGRLIPCGNDHERFIIKNQGIFSKMGFWGLNSGDLLDKGWSKIGFIERSLYLETHKITNFLFELMQTLVLQENPREVEIVVRNDVVRMSKEEFLEACKISDITRSPSFSFGDKRGSVRVSSLPKSRNILLGVSLDELSWPLRQALDILELSPKKDSLSANQIVSAFQSNNQLLEDTLGRNYIDLIRDLNEFVQFGGSYVRDSY